MKEKMIKTANMLDKLAKFGQILVAVCGLIVVAATIFVLVSGGNSNTFSQTITVGALSLTLKPDAVIPDIISDNFWIRIGFVITSVIEWIIVFISLTIMRTIILPIKDGKPFETGISDKIRNLAYVYLFTEILASVAKFVFSLDSVSTLNYITSYLLNMDLIEKVTVKYTFSFDCLIVFGIIMLVSYIFKYGEELQIESDETL